MSGIFISYRREDSAPAARQIFEALSDRFGAGSVFIDVEGIQPGQIFPEVIDETVGFCEVLIAVIGPQWLTRCGGDGRPRLSDPEDWVRLEISAALSRKTHVIPVLTGGAAAPRREQLPDSLKLLAERQAVAIEPACPEKGIALLIAAVEAARKPPGPAGMWFDILTRRQQALDPLDFHKPEVLWRALRFLLYMVIAETVIHFPADAQERIRWWNPGFLLSNITANYMAYLFLGLVLHFAMRAGGGQAALQKSVIAFCYLAAYLPLIAICQIPAWGTDFHVLEATPDPSWTPEMLLEELNRTVSGIGAFGAAKIVVSFVCSTAMWMLMLSATFESYRTLHRLAKDKARLFFAAGLAPLLLFLLFFFSPYQGRVYRQFQEPVPGMSGNWTREDGSPISIRDTAGQVELNMGGCAGPRRYTGSFHAGVAELTSTPLKLCGLPDQVIDQLIRRLNYKFRAELRWLDTNHLELVTYSDDVNYDGKTNLVSGIKYGRTPEREKLSRSERAGR